MKKKSGPSFTVKEQERARARLVAEYAPTTADAADPSVLATVASEGMRTKNEPTNLGGRPFDQKNFGSHAPDPARVAELAVSRRDAMDRHLAAYQAVACDVVFDAVNARK